ncbi:MAG TPA: hypothetical protein VJW23_14385 [Propionibacteriaceae bacterium]|nr:hypothetical protein [Propionibacteriaceae bacterium]
MRRTKSSTCGTITNGSRIAVRRSMSGILVKDGVVSVMVRPLLPADSGDSRHSGEFGDDHHR